MRLFFGNRTSAHTGTEQVQGKTGGGEREVYCLMMRFCFTLSYRDQGSIASINLALDDGCQIRKNGTTLHSVAFKLDLHTHVSHQCKVHRLRHTAFLPVVAVVKMRGIRRVKREDSVRIFFGSRFAHCARMFNKLNFTVDHNRGQPREGSVQSVPNGVIAWWQRRRE